MHSDSADPTPQRKVALVTGGSCGLGFALAERLVAEGYRVVILARDEGRLGEAVAKLSMGAGSALGIPCDVTDPASLLNAAERLRECEARLDFLVANVGSLHLGLLEELPPETVLADIESGLSGTVLTARTFLPFLGAGSKVLFIASGFGLMGAAGYATYCAANAGIINFAEAIRREWLRRDISVYVACPSDIKTPGYQKEMEGLRPWMKRAEIRGDPMEPRTAAGRILDRCRGNRFLILINPELRFFHFAKRLFPDRTGRRILDRLFPMPPRQDSEDTG
jgi:NAD(P)-dependent dehydrogenase (short-subunit alcohol dehydrogenase family)